MTITSGYIIALIGILSAINFIRLSIPSRSASNTRLALASLKTLRSLVENVPKHRGMTNAFLQGDTSFRNKMEPVQTEIMQSLKILAQQAQELKSTHITNSSNIALSKWQELHNSIYSLQAPKSFELHSELIQQILYIMEDISDEFGLTNSNSPEDNSMFETLIRSLPDLTETLGQARGIGAGVAAKQQCDVATRVKLKYLHQHIQQIISRTLSTQQNTDSNIHIAIEKTIKDTNSFLDLLQNEIINAQFIQIKPDHFYTLATEAISSGFALFDIMFPIAERETINSLEKERKSVISQKVVSSLMIVSLLAVTFLIM